MKNPSFASGSDRQLKYRLFRNKTRPKRASWEKENYSQWEGGPPMVKGISKRIIVVKSPDPRIFEQAIFIVREDYMGQTGVSQTQLLRQARLAAGNYLAPGGKDRGSVFPRLRGLLYAAAGAAATALAWVMVQMARVM